MTGETTQMTLSTKCRANESCFLPTIIYILKIC